MKIELEPIGFVRSARLEPIDDDWDAVASRIELEPSRFGPEALLGLDAFSHVEIIYHFHSARPDRMVTGARHPRGRTDWPQVGIFGQRGKDRPNHLGVTICRLRGVRHLTLELEGLDAIDGTPVLDIKPVMAEFLPRGKVRQPSWSKELMRSYWRRD
jgi:tRNA (Thr-GGU) A37 N-methylase